MSTSPFDVILWGATGFVGRTRQMIERCQDQARRSGE
jgi:short subunit dehydrogenase-like uncharacterized protein